MHLNSVGKAFATVIVAITAVIASQANAAPIQLEYSFTAQDFFSFAGPPPNDPVSGSFTIAYDSVIGGGGSPSAVGAFTIGTFTYDATNTAFNAAPNGNGLNIAFGRSGFGADNFMLQFTVEDDGEPIFGPGAFSYTRTATIGRLHESGSYEQHRSQSQWSVGSSDFPASARQLCFRR